MKQVSFYTWVRYLEVKVKRYAPYVSTKTLNYSITELYSQHFHLEFYAAKSVHVRSSFRVLNTQRSWHIYASFSIYIFVLGVLIKAQKYSCKVYIVVARCSQN